MQAFAGRAEVVCVVVLCTCALYQSVAQWCGRMHGQWEREEECVIKREVWRVETGTKRIDM